MQGILRIYIFKAFHEDIYYIIRREYFKKIYPVDNATSYVPFCIYIYVSACYTSQRLKQHDSTLNGQLAGLVFIIQLSAKGDQYKATNGIE